ncbi:hypothetical protein D3C83_91060 [compost metagenome]
MARQRVEVHHLPPVLGSEEHDRHRFLHPARLRQRQQLEQLVERAVAAREHDHRLREIGEPELAHEKVMKVDR